MATTEYGVNDALAVKLWSKKLFQEALKKTYFSRFLGKTSSSLIQIKDETSKGPGDRITIGLRMQLAGASSKKSRMWRTLVSKSPFPIFGRNFTSLTVPCVVLRRDSFAFCASS